MLDGLMSEDGKARRNASRTMTKITFGKKDAWPSRQAAYGELSKRPATKNWHTDVLKKFVVSVISHVTLIVDRRRRRLISMARKMASATILRQSSPTPLASEAAWPSQPVGIVNL